MSVVLLTIAEYAAILRILVKHLEVKLWLCVNEPPPHTCRVVAMGYTSPLRYKTDIT